jgi:RND superfamily putative drug exporter
VLSVLSALFATPAILMLLGAHLDRWSLPGRRDPQGAVLSWSQRLVRRPAPALGIAFVLFLCAIWAFTLETKVGTVAQLPPDNSSRLQHEDVQRTLGQGWIAPLEVVVSSNGGPVTTPPRLRALTAFQRQVEEDPGVTTMAGFSSLAPATRELAGVEPGLLAQERGLDRVDSGLSRIHGGSAATTDGFLSAAGGAQELGSAIGAARQGGGLLAEGLRSTARGSERLSGGLERTEEGSGKLASGASKSSNGADRLAKALRRAEERAGDSQGSARVLENALERGERSLSGLDASVAAGEDGLAAARQALQRMSAGRSDPQYATALAAVEEATRALSGAEPGEELPEPPPNGVGAGIQSAQSQFDLALYLAARIAKDGGSSQEGMAKLARAAARLDRGLRRLAASSEELSDGVAELAGGGDQLSPGLHKLTASAERLVGGLGEIGGGAEQLAGGLDQGAQRSTVLTGALHRLDSGIERGQGGGGGMSGLQQNSPGLFRSGYFYLAGLDGSKPEQRTQAGFVVNLGAGGTAARMLVIPGDDPTTEEARETQDRLRDHAGELAEAADAEVLVGGVSPSVVDVDAALREQAPVARIALSLVTILIILLVTRSLALALLAAAFNLITVSATFGLMSLLFDGSLLGGPGYVDSTIIPASIILIFGLAIDYEVFIFARMREEYVRTGSAATAITNGLARSANVVTGAALIMIAVFLAFAISPLVTIRNLGVALSIAVFIDAFLIRFVIVPATMAALGERSWWIPRWLDRLLPGGGPPLLAREATGG